ncbi:MAG: carbohydrate ABC transporter permease [Bacillota bacterium]
MKNKNNKSWLFTLPYVTLFSIFIVIPVLAAFALSLTHFNLVNFPEWRGLVNYIQLLTNDPVFMQHVLPNTLKFALIVGPGGYALGFILAWSLAQVTKKARIIMALIIYSPSLTAGIAMAVLWRIIFSGDQSGYLNAVLLNMRIIETPIQWLQSPEHLMTIMIIVSLWSSMGVGFLAMLSGILNVDQELYEAAYIDGMKTRFQEIFYITIPSMKPQMLFGAVMAIVNTFNIGAVGVQLSGVNPTPQYSGQLIVNHIEDYGFIRFEMGYAAAISVVLLVIVYAISKLAWRLFGEKN